MFRITWHCRLVISALVSLVNMYGLYNCLDDLFNKGGVSGGEVFVLLEFAYLGVMALVIFASNLVSVMPKWTDLIRVCILTTGLLRLDWLALIILTRDTPFLPSPEHTVSAFLFCIFYILLWLALPKCICKKKAVEK